MADRKSIPKKIRFEVFKRDKFTCQYCGRSAPDVILEVDHILPVAEGGGNDLLNLITSCKDCNRGKGAKKLSDDSAVKKQQAQLMDLAEKKEQLDMMIKWKNELLSFRDVEVNAFIDFVRDNYMPGFGLTEQGRENTKKWIKDYTLEVVIDAFERSWNQNDKASIESAFSRIPRIAYYIKNPMSDMQKNIFYLRKILINRLHYVNKSLAYKLIKEAMTSGVSFEELKDVCATCRNWTDFCNIMENEYDARFE